MTEILYIHPVTPQPRLIQQAVAILEADGVMAYPTDSTYALGCKIANKKGVDRIRVLRRLGGEHPFTLICNDLSELATYAIFDNPIYRLLKANTPGPYTFILPATKEVPRRFLHPKRKTVGIRIPDSLIIKMLLKELKAPLLSVTLYVPKEENPIADISSACDWLDNNVDLIIDAGKCSVEQTTVIDFANAAPKILRIGKGDPDPFL